LIKKDWFIATNITLLILLLFAWNERWNVGPKIKISNGYVQNNKDNWTDQKWISIYNNEEFGEERFVPNNQKHLIDPWGLRNILNWGWIVLTFSTLFFSVNGLLRKLSRKSENFESID
jgi:hypothetical protein